MLVLLISSTELSYAQNSYYCVREGATGTGNGLDWNNAYPTIPGTLVRGATYYVASGSYGSYNFNTATQGSLFVTIKKATVYEHGSSAGWSDSYGYGQAEFGSLTISTDNYLIDEVTGGGPGQWETGFGFRVKSGGKNIYLNGAIQNITISHVDIENMGRYTKIVARIVFMHRQRGLKILLSIIATSMTFAELCY